MPLPAIFMQDEQTARLAAYFEDIYGYLLEQGVPEVRLPSPWHVLSHMVDCLDGDRVAEWLEAYVGIEGVASDNPSELPAALSGPAPKRPRPAYLRALSDNVAKVSDPSESDP